MNRSDRIMAIALIFLCLIFIGFVFFAWDARAADVIFTWDASVGAEGYKVYISTDLGVTWAEERDAGAQTTFTWTGAPDSGLLLFRASAYNAQGEAIRTESGAWFNGDWKPPEQASSLGIQ